jgi:hypothetical protein
VCEQEKVFMPAIRITAALLFATVLYPSSGRADDSEDRLGAVISDLRACVRSNAEAARSTGVKSASDAVDFFRRVCDQVIFDGLRKANDVAVPPGRFRKVLLEEWTAAIEPKNR